MCYTDIEVILWNCYSCGIFMIAPAMEALQKLQLEHPSVKVFCDIKWSKFGFPHCEYFGLKNDAFFRRLGRNAWEKLVKQKEFTEQKINKNKEEV